MSNSKFKEVNNNSKLRDLAKLALCLVVYVMLFNMAYISIVVLANVSDWSYMVPQGDQWLELFLLPAGGWGGVMYGKIFTSVP